MKLISCYIENFGNIRRRSFDFDVGLTSYCEHNGYGKTTLAAFLKAMFYGLKQTTARDKELGERARYYPFEGGKFGGNVVFDKDGVIYKIERFFGKKSATDDSLTIYADDRIIDVEDLGKEFFGLDEQSFLRTVFLNSADTESGATGDISRMLNGFVDDADYEGAKKILEKKQKLYKAARGRGGAIDDKHEEVLRLKENISNKEKINGELGRKYAERRTLSAMIAGLEKSQNLSRDRELILQKWQTYDGIVADAEAESEKLKPFNDKYPEGLPEEGEIQELKKQAEELILANERHISTTFSPEKVQKYVSLAARFAKETPADDEIASANNGAAEIIRLDAEIANLEREAALPDNKFAAGVPDDEEVKKCGEKIAAIREKKNEPPVKKGSASKKIAIALAVLALAALGAGAGIMFVKFALHYIIGGALLGLGGALALAAVFTYFTGQINAMKAVPATDDGEKERIKLFLARWGYYSDGGMEVDYNNLVRDLESYRAAAYEKEKCEERLKEKRAEADKVKTDVKNFLEKYGFAGENPQADLMKLGTLTAEYVALKAEKDEFTAKIEESGAEIENITRTINNILEKYSVEADGSYGSVAAEIEKDKNEFERINRNIERLEQRAEEFREENGLTERPTENDDAREIAASLSRKRDEISLLDREISEDESAVERLAELREEYEAALSEEVALRKKYDIISATIDLLDRAEQNLKDRYISPVKNSFLGYSNILEKVLGERVTFDKDFKVKFERGGENRSDAHLSAGQKSLCALCLRLALIDNMYKGEKPFIIMDDPFVHLDGEHMRRAEQLMRELARGRQIIYFCCHESRKI